MQKEHYSIGDASKKCHIPVQTIRYYDDIDLLKPQYRDTNSNYRYYSKSQLTTLMIIRRLRDIDFSINEIREILTNTNLQAYEERLLNHKKSLENTMQTLKKSVSICDDLLEKIQLGRKLNEGEIPNVIRLEKFPKRMLLCQRETMKLYCNYEVSLDRWYNILMESFSSNLFTKGNVFVIYHCQPLDQFLMKDCDVEFCIEVIPESGVTTQTDIDSNHMKSWECKLAATLCHLGKYTDIIQSHIKLLQWINKNGYSAAGPISEEFIISPLDTNDENLYLTKIIIPIEKNQK